MDFSALLLSFIEGIGIILSPCILPILPLLLATGIQGDKRRPYGVMTGFIFMFVLFTLLSRKLFTTLNISQENLQNFSSVLLIVFGAILFFDALSNKFNQLTSKIAGLGNTLSNRFDSLSSQGFISGFLFGGCIAFIWTPCAGPILAAILVQTIQQHNDKAAIVSLIFFSLGVAIPMLLITIFGRKLLNQMQFFKKNTHYIRKALAIIIVSSVFLNKIDFWSKVFSQDSNIADSTPNEIDKNKNDIVPSEISGKLKNPLAIPYKAPEIEGASARKNTETASESPWINSQALDLKQLKGKVVLIDFWTYSCINCIRTLPHIKKWHDKYHEKGLVIIGVHAPEFEFEKDKNNVLNAIQKFNIHYPVVMDNNLEIWGHFKNSYWPAHYLINKEGEVVYTHFGEGEYDATENNIRILLGLNKNDSDDKKSEELSKQTILYDQSPETYLGYLRGVKFCSPQTIKQDETNTYSYPNTLNLHSWALQGKWRIEGEKIIAMEDGASLKYKFKAKKVFIVLGINNQVKNSSQKFIEANIKVDDNVSLSENGKDAPYGKIQLENHTLYEVINQREAEEKTIEIIASKKGLEAYALTFG